MTAVTVLPMGIKHADNFPGRLGYAMSQREVSDGELERRVGISKGYGTRLRNGYAEQPHIDTQRQIARALSISVEWLAFGEPRPNGLDAPDTWHVDPDGWAAAVRAAKAKHGDSLSGHWIYAARNKAKREGISKVDPETVRALALECAQEFKLKPFLEAHALAGFRKAERRRETAAGVPGAPPRPSQRPSGARPRMLKRPG